MNTLYIAWQDPQTRLWHTVGRLTKETNAYCFAYTKGALSSSQFGYFGRMYDLHKKYYSHELFPLFANRILNSSRPEYPAYLRWLALDPETANEPMQLLARSGGKRATDELCVFPCPEINQHGEMELFFLAHGLRYLDPASLDRLAQLQTGERLQFRPEQTNAYDSFALILETEECTKVGYCPRYLNRDLHKLIGNTEIRLTVERLNHEAPIQFRLLCKTAFVPPSEIALFADEEYQLLYEENAVAA